MKDGRIAPPNRTEYYPMLMTETPSFSGVEGNNTQATAAKWERFHQISKEQQIVLGSSAVAYKLYALERQFQVHPETIGRISLALRWLFFGQIDWTAFSAKIDAILLGEGLKFDVSPQVLGYIKQEILDMKSEDAKLFDQSLEEESLEDQNQEENNSESVSTSVKSMQILQALTEFPELHNQRVTEARIKIKSETGEVAPTVRNWLRSYRDELGIGAHTVIERGRFLFQTVNTHTLSTPERERLSLLVKSLDEQTPLSIDTQEKKILFPEVPTTQASPTPLPVPVPSISAAPTISLVSTSPMARHTPPLTPAPVASLPLVSQPVSRVPLPTRIAPAMSLPSTGLPEAVNAKSLTFSSGHRMLGEEDAWHRAMAEKP